ncbi:hypothetical protein Hanom_Chr17g01534841 [Helianthus anomalus]
MNHPLSPFILCNSPSLTIPFLHHHLTKFTTQTTTITANLTFLLFIFPKFNLFFKTQTIIPSCCYCNRLPNKNRDTHILHT